MYALSFFFSFVLSHLLSFMQDEHVLSSEVDFSDSDNDAPAEADEYHDDGIESNGNSQLEEDLSVRININSVIDIFVTV